jgi:two-component system, NarL family, sensor kinase
LQIVIEDNGVGLVVDAETARAGGGGFGLTGITERVSVIGGRAQFDAAPGRGTRVFLTFGGQGTRGGS